MKRHLLSSLCCLLVGTASASAQDVLGVSLPAAPIVSVSGGCYPPPCAPDDVATFLTPFEGSQAGVIGTWRGQFLGGSDTSGCVIPARIQLKVFRWTSATSARVVAVGAVHEPKAILEARFGYACPHPDIGSEASVLEFSEAGVQVGPGDALGLTIGAAPEVGWFLYPFLEMPAISRALVGDAQLGETIDLANAYASDPLVPAMQVFVAPAVLDLDGDGVPDGADACPGSAPGSIVDASGCPPDSDGDGVADVSDACPGTAPGTVVDATGCPPDADGDGVADVADACPDSAPGTVVDASGCPLDRDGDGLPDFADACPDSPAGALIDANGCSIDDLCPCASPDWRNHGDYVSCVSHVAYVWMLSGMIDEAQKEAAVSAAAGSTCGAQTASWTPSRSRRR